MMEFLRHTGRLESGKASKPMTTENRINDLLQRLNPSKTALLDWLRPQVDDASEQSFT